MSKGERRKAKAAKISVNPYKSYYIQTSHHAGRSFDYLLCLHLTGGFPPHAWLIWKLPCLISFHLRPNFIKPEGIIEGPSFYSTGGLPKQ